MVLLLEVLSVVVCISLYTCTWKKQYEPEMRLARRHVFLYFRGEMLHGSWIDMDDRASSELSQAISNMPLLPLPLSRRCPQPPGKQFLIMEYGVDQPKQTISPM